MQFGRCNRIAKQCHHGSDNGSVRGPYCCIYISLAFKAHNKGWRATHSSPMNSPKLGETPHHLQAELCWPQWPWASSACGRPYPRNSTVQINCAPHQPPPNEWVCPSGSKEPRGGWPGGHLSRRGKVGSTEATHSSCRTTSWRKGSLWTTPVTTMSCTGRIRHGAINYHPNIGSAHWHP